MHADPRRLDRRWASTTRRTPVTKQSHGDVVFQEPPAGLLTYPTNRVIALMEDPDNVGNAIDELVAAGFSSGDMHVLCGPSGAERLGLSGRRSLGGCLYRYSRPVEGREDLKTYARHMKRGGLVVSIPAEADRVEIVARVVEKHGGHEMTHYGKGRRVQLEPWPDSVDEPQPPPGSGVG
jgi:hypothetical protein